MIWSIIPEELIFSAEPRREIGQSVDYQGRRLYLRRGRIEGLLSTEPLDYLDRRFRPGAVFTPENGGRDRR